MKKDTSKTQNIFSLSFTISNYFVEHQNLVDLGAVVISKIQHLCNTTIADIVFRNINAGCSMNFWICNNNDKMECPIYIYSFTICLITHFWSLFYIRKKKKVFILQISQIKHFHACVLSIPTIYRVFYRIKRKSFQYCSSHFKISSSFFFFFFQ